MTTPPGHETFTRAHPGDLIVTQATNGGPVRVGTVTTTNREGLARHVNWTHDPDTANETMRKPRRTLLAPPDRVTDMNAALEAARNASPCHSLTDMLTALRPHLTPIPEQDS